MDNKRFEALLKELDGNSVRTLTEKNKKYSADGDALHNFRSGADIFGGTPAKACWGYLTKHLVALRDMVEKDDFSDRADFLEKCQDSINYIRFLWCIGNESNEARAWFNMPVDRADSDEIRFSNEADAKAVLSAMKDVINRYGFVTVLDMYDLSSCDTTDYTSSRRGWNDLRSAKIVLEHDGYAIELPKPLPTSAFINSNEKENN